MTAPLCTRCRNEPRSGTSSWGIQCKRDHRAGRRVVRNRSRVLGGSSKPLAQIPRELQMTLYEHYTGESQR